MLPSISIGILSRTPPENAGERPVEKKDGRKEWFESSPRIVVQEGT